jgi:hypothetical protein
LSRENINIPNIKATFFLWADTKTDLEINTECHQTPNIKEG